MLEIEAFKAVKKFMSDQGIDNLEPYSQEASVLMVKYLKSLGTSADLHCYKLPGRGLHYCVLTDEYLVDPTISDWPKPPHGSQRGQLFYVLDKDAPHENWREIEIESEKVMSEVDIDFKAPECQPR